MPGCIPFGTSGIVIVLIICFLERYGESAAVSEALPIAVWHINFEHGRSETIIDIFGFAVVVGVYKVIQSPLPNGFGNNPTGKFYIEAGSS